MADMEHIATIERTTTSTPSVYVTFSFTGVPTTYPHLYFHGILTNPSSSSDGFVYVALNGDTPGVSNTYDSSSFGVNGGNPDQFLNGNDSLYAMRYYKNKSSGFSDDAPFIIEGWIPFANGRSSSKYYGCQQIITRASQANSSTGTNTGSSMFGRIERPLTNADITQIDFQAWPGCTAGDYIALFGLKG